MVVSYIIFDASALILPTYLFLFGTFFYCMTWGLSKILSIMQGKKIIRIVDDKPKPKKKGVIIIRKDNLHSLGRDLKKIEKSVKKTRKQTSKKNKVSLLRKMIEGTV